ncbi:putative Co-chaperone HscB [Gregarina niphandrodes]|uniref:Co-chaperone HscB n=1 Tax=Gregarina niphandrodes TaxID=110365 RepID=A0A023AYJ1_GRENI|nr:putative Co-chaperone HscB [Gregarina niphandrodes]EZG43719.1 putative Co-chaperone HscB [Gregarina niphandrodes]|eukprot:XP_011133049.1 putative Co-chaperone HscB [Gregarina niphandrodes]
MVVVPFVGKAPKTYRFAANLVTRGNGNINGPSFSDPGCLGRSLHRDRKQPAWLSNRAFASTGAVPSNRSATDYQCGKCQAWLKSYETLCQSCKSFAPPQLSARYLKNPWTAFECLENQSLSYDVPLNEITKEYRSRMIELHPDRVIGAGGSSQESGLATHHSSMLRSGYELLKNPVSRADLLCQLKYDRQFLKEDSNIEDNDFMTDILMAIEYVDELTAEENRQDLIAFRKEWTDRLEHQATCMADCFTLLTNNLRESKSNEVLNQIRNTLHISISIKKLLGMLDNKVIELGIEL